MRYRFGDFTMDLDLYELHRSGEPVEIQPKAFDLLRHLVENAERTVSKEELLDAVWAGKAEPGWRRGLGSRPSHRCDGHARVTEGGEQQSGLRRQGELEVEDDAGETYQVESVLLWLPLSRY